MVSDDGMICLSVTTVFFSISKATPVQDTVKILIMTTKSNSQGFNFLTLFVVPSLRKTNNVLLYVLRALQDYYLSK